ncbi:MAG: hypothetical protein AB8G22_08100 [Saprospiraceae bacterium]
MIKIFKFTISLFILILFSLYILLQVATTRVIKERPQEIVLTPTPLTEDTLRQLDSVRVIATDIYQGGRLKKILQGETYREAWATPVNVPILWLDTLHGGIIADDKGGGDQTLSLDLVDSTGMVYTIRSINKDPSGLVAPWIKKIGLENIIMDGISAQHPYGALAIPPLSDAANVYHTHPQLYFIPPQKNLGKFSETFGNRLFYLEYEPEGEHFWDSLDTVVEIVDTYDVQQALKKNEHAQIDTMMLLRARMLDLIIGDWDRHAKQWGWVETKRGAATIFYPIATDRDNIFYKIGGIIPWIINRPIFVQRLRPFMKEIDHIKGLVHPFDSYFLYEIPSSYYQSAAQEVRQNVTDEVIHTAIAQLPRELYAQDGKRLIETIQARREQLPQFAEAFYQAIQKRGPQIEPIKGDPDYKKKFGKKDR